eukprot:Gregarina_sp_Poly_1__2030@NODE_1533_length_3917_cov_30_684935_g252_i1_p1_GENE_NODE_1533_length_3917_cov_30_684935_g252_i1NODE_1533_length_3917_cov_30_684935_g252_i1_p1_ORF_typecomplete_len583_score73_87FAD_binding_1/PF00667_20/2_3e03FAD_binding_1/PF00667_20/4_3e16Flavodoxin_1/PF00258_25/0_0021_NODE_1533_length_3917_cov_30_684935_g252_i118283576
MCSFDNLAQDVEHCLKSADANTKRVSIQNSNPTEFAKCSAVVIIVATQFHGQSHPRDAAFFSYLQQVPDSSRWSKFTAFGIDWRENDNQFQSLKRLLTLAKKSGWNQLCDSACGDASDMYTLLCQLDDWLLRTVLPACNLMLPTGSEDDEDETPRFLTSPTRASFSKEYPCADPPRLLNALERMSPKETYYEFVVSRNDGQFIQLTSTSAGHIMESSLMLEVWPLNHSNAVDDFLSVFEQKEMPMLRMQSSSRKFLDGYSVGFILKYLVDINVSPSRAVLNQMSQFFTGKFKSKLRELSQFSTEGVSAYCDYISNYRRSVTEVMFDFQEGIQRDFELNLIQFLIAHLPLIHTRSYFVSHNARWSSFSTAQSQLRRLFPAESPNYIARIAAKLVAAEVPTSGFLTFQYNRVFWPTKVPHRKVEGSCSLYLSSIQTGDVIIARPSVQSLKLDPEALNMFLCFDNGFYYARTAAQSAIFQNAKVVVYAAPPKHTQNPQIGDLLHLSRCFPENFRVFVTNDIGETPAAGLLQIMESSDVAGDNEPEIRVTVTALGFPCGGRPSVVVDALEDIFDGHKIRTTYLKHL